VTDGGKAIQAQRNADDVISRLIAHPRLPLVAGLDANRPAIHIWEVGPDGLRALEVVDGGGEPYDQERPWETHRRLPSAAWHPQEPILAVTFGAGVTTWSREAAGQKRAVAQAGAYRWVAFAPDGGAIWASPSATGPDDEAWRKSDMIAFPSGAQRAGLAAWDTGVAAHPGGDLVLTLLSEQVATLGIFARVDRSGDGPMLRPLSRALILDADGYEEPVFSPDGRYVAIRGNAYENTLQVFELPEIRDVLATTLGKPSPGYPYPDDWLAEMKKWSRHNIAFAVHARSDLLVGTPDGRMVEIDLATGRASEVEVPGRPPVSALTVTADGRVVVASGDGGLLVLPDRGNGQPALHRAAAAEVAVAFLASVTELPEGIEVEEAVETTDGQRIFTPRDLEVVAESIEADPVWLRMRAANNALLQRGVRDRGSDQPT
jgi:hypothetical protein